MTTVVFRIDKEKGVATAAADTFVTKDYPVHDKKIHRVKDTLYGAGGNARDCHAFLEWLKAGCPDDAIPAINAESFEGITFNWKTGLWYWESCRHSNKVKADFFAVGSGASWALGALEMGATAERAAKIACKYDPYSKHPTRVLKLCRS